MAGPGRGGEALTGRRLKVAWHGNYNMQRAECRVQQVPDKIVHVLQNEGRFGLTTPEKEE